MLNLGSLEKRKTVKTGHDSLIFRFPSVIINLVELVGIWNLGIEILWESSHVGSRLHLSVWKNVSDQ